MSALLLCAFAFTANATIYTAASSGNFSTNGTWQGGMSPGSMVSGDTVIIPGGINVTLNQDVMFNATSSLVVNGALAGSGTNSLAILGAFAGTGTLSADSIHLSKPSPFAFTGTMTVGKLNVEATGVTSAATITVNEMLYITSGIFTVTAGNVVMGTNSTIVFDGGFLTPTANFTLTNKYNVIYNTPVNTGVELQGTGLSKIEVNPGAGQKVVLDNDLTITGELALTSGSIELNMNDLAFVGKGKLTETGGSIMSTSASDITIATEGDLVGAMRFSGGLNTVGKLTLDMDTSIAKAVLKSDMKIATELELIKGKLDIDDHKLSLISGAIVSGGVPISYVIAEDDGRMIQDVDAGTSKFFPIGTNNYFAPVEIEGNTGHKPGQVSAGVLDGVLQGVTYGYDVAATKPVVGSTWLITSTSASEDVDVTLSWMPPQEKNGFDQTSCYVSRNTGGWWDADTASAANVSSVGYFSQTRTGVKQLTAFTVGDDSNNGLTVGNTTAANDNTISIYPNPVGDVLNISYTADVPATAHIFSTTGQLVKTLTLTGGVNTINVSSLNSGMYHLKVSSQNSVKNKQFIVR